MTLKAAPYEVMVTGEKKVEFRKVSKWMESRLFSKDGDRQYDRVVFVNGYRRRPTTVLHIVQGVQACIRRCLQTIL